MKAKLSDSKSGTIFCFGSEPGYRVSRNSKSEHVRLGSEGSADKAGAQTRLGETKKSFHQGKLENPHCVTMFLPSGSSWVQRECRAQF